MSDHYLTTLVTLDSPCIKPHIGDCTSNKLFYKPSDDRQRAQSLLVAYDLTVTSDLCVSWVRRQRTFTHRIYFFVIYIPVYRLHEVDIDWKCSKGPLPTHKHTRNKQRCRNLILVQPPRAPLEAFIIRSLSHPALVCLKPWTALIVGTGKGLFRLGLLLKIPASCNQVRIVCLISSCSVETSCYRL